MILWTISHQNDVSLVGWIILIGRSPSCTNDTEKNVMVISDWARTSKNQKSIFDQSVFQTMCLWKNLWIRCKLSQTFRKYKNGVMFLTPRSGSFSDVDVFVRLGKKRRWASPESLQSLEPWSQKRLTERSFEFYFLLLVSVLVLVLVPFSFQNVLQFPNNKLGTHTWQENSFFASLWTCGWPHCASLEKKRPD